MATEATDGIQEGVQVRVEVRLYLSEQGRAAVLAETGRDPVGPGCATRTYVVSGYLEDLPLDLRRHLVEAKGPHPAYLLDSVFVPEETVIGWREVEKRLEVHNPSDLPAFCEAVRQWLDLFASTADARRRYEQWRRELHARERERYEQSQREQAERRRREAEEVEEFDAEMRRWAEQHGSQRLRRALERGYNCRGLYARERAALEWPGWLCNPYSHVEWEDRVNPTMAALDLESRAIEHARSLGMPDPERHVWVVWLRAYRADEHDREHDRETEQEAREAVIVTDYLGRDRYVLIGWPGEEGRAEGR